VAEVGSIRGAGLACRAISSPSTLKKAIDVFRRGIVGLTQSRWCLGFYWPDFQWGISAMRAQFRLYDLIPAELNVEAVHHGADAIVVAAHGRSRDCRCPECGTISHRIHSRYARMIADLPCAGRRIELHLTVRRFVCSANQCRRKIFAERLGDDIVRPMARRTARLDTLVRHLALA